jgi:hypothetical protein
VIAEHPEYFKKFDCQGCYDVNNVDGYVNSVVQKMGQKGYCAMYDGEDWRSRPPTPSTSSSTS